jgi:hypothetical protein
VSGRAVGQPSSRGRPGRGEKVGKVDGGRGGDPADPRALRPRGRAIILSGSWGLDPKVGPEWIPREDREWILGSGVDPADGSRVDPKVGLEWIPWGISGWDPQGTGGSRG